MMVRAKIQGRLATIVYIDEQFNLVSDTEATRAKILFDDGEVWFMKLDGNNPESVLLHVFESEGQKSAQMNIKGSTYNIDMTPEISALDEGDYEITLEYA